MKVIVVCDENGEIISIGRRGHPVDDESSGTARVEFAAEGGQLVQEIELPEEFEQGSLIELHNGFRVELKDGGPHFVRGHQGT